MSDRMPDRMPEYMSDRISEYIQDMSKYTSCHVMVEITGSKVTKPFQYQNVEILQNEIPKILVQNDGHIPFLEP